VGASGGTGVARVASTPQPETTIASAEREDREREERDRAAQPSTAL
jgi:hypothetical protein